MLTPCWGKLEQIRSGEAIYITLIFRVIAAIRPLFLSFHFGQKQSCFFLVKSERLNVPVFRKTTFRSKG